MLHKHSILPLVWPSCKHYMLCIPSVINTGKILQTKSFTSQEWFKYINLNKKSMAGNNIHRKSTKLTRHTVVLDRSIKVYSLLTVNLVALWYISSSSHTLISQTRGRTIQKSNSGTVEHHYNGDLGTMKI